MFNICAKNNLTDTRFLWVWAIVFIVVFAVIIALIKHYKWSLFRIDRMKGHDFERFMKEVYTT